MSKQAEMATKQQQPPGESSASIKYCIDDLEQIQHHTQHTTTRWNKHHQKNGTLMYLLRLLWPKYCPNQWMK
uniref:Uncharacterized protein n=1 Tax=Romanomermis culicivorax TaxID=13658 RepID=A0A915IBT4_ROMCU